ncbi:hypothetical protein [Pseudomonas brassicacearum]|uniref:hypothetical protein n=1 Tax=Pseudomonas brassicacearum TaxID=930166 RepID=UPI001E469A4C|nr:hypothetical protein [Pseudomonas brassicacearum]
MPAPLVSKASSSSCSVRTTSGRLKIGGNMGLATLLPQIIDHARHGGGEEADGVAAPRAGRL